MRALFVAAALLAASITSVSAQRQLDVRLNVEAAEAALTILERQHNGQALRASDWRRLFASDGYIRLKEREVGMGRPFEDAEFRAFLTSREQIERAPILRAALEDWRGMSAEAAAERAFAYLPDDATIRATVFIMIKPRTNSFVWDVANDPAIILYLNPEQSAAVTQNTAAHEMHHIGYGTTCPPEEREPLTPRSEAESRLRMWIGGFGEGYAMLAAAGSVDTHPHADSPPETRARWDRDVANVAAQMADQNAFFARVLSGELTDIEAIDTQARTYYGEQGPWYTVGYVMASTVERAYGRERLIAAMCQQAPMLALYNEAARSLNANLPLWDNEVAARLAQ